MVSHNPSTPNFLLFTQPTLPQCQNKQNQGSLMIQYQCNYFHVTDCTHVPRLSYMSNFGWFFKSVFSTWSEGRSGVHLLERLELHLAVLAEISIV